MLANLQCKVVGQSVYKGCQTWGRILSPLNDMCTTAYMRQSRVSCYDWRTVATELGGRKRSARGPKAKSGLTSPRSVGTKRQEALSSLTYQSAMYPISKKVVAVRQCEMDFSAAALGVEFVLIELKYHRGHGSLLLA